MSKKLLISSNNIIALCLLMAALYWSSLYNFLLFHTVVELFSIIIAFGIFMLAWNARQILQNNYLLFLGIAYFFVGFVDLLHTINYKGMGIFPTPDANLPTQLWIVARYLESLSLLLAPFFFTRRLRPYLIVACFTLLTGGVLVMIKGGIFPDCFVEGAGLTPFKKISEYLISIILLGAFFLLLRKRRLFDDGVFNLIAASIFFTIGAELAFTFYISIYGISNVVGHFCKFISFYLIYKALIETGLRQPVSLLVRNLRENEALIRENERKYRSLFNNMLDGFAYHRIVTDDYGTPIDYVFLEINSAFETITGLKKDDVLGKRVTEVLPGFDRSDFDWIDEYGKVALTGTMLRLEQYSAPLSKWFSISAFSPEERYFAVVFEDITLRKQADIALRQSEERYRNLYEGSRDGYAAVNMDGFIVDANSAFRKMLGYSIEELRGLTFNEITPPEWHEMEGEMIDILLDTGHTPLWEKEFQRKDGGIFPSELRANLMRDEEGRPTGAWAFIRDITERKKAEAAKEQNLAQLNILLQVSTSLLSATSMQNMLENIVKGAIELTGARVGTSGHGYQEGSFQVGVTVRSEGTQPCPLGDNFAVAKGGVFMDLMEKNSVLRLTNKELSCHPKWWGLPEGHVPLVGLLGVSLIGRHGTPRGLIMVSDKNEGDFSNKDEILLSQLATLASLGLQNIEARDEAENKAREADEGRQRLGVLTQELERSNNDLLQFAYSVAHDLHEPLHTVSSFVQLLSRRYRGNLDAKADDYIAHTVKGTEHMQQLLNDLLAYSKVGGGKLDLKAIDLTSALERARINLKRTIEESQVTLRYNGLPTVHADELQLSQIFQNLIANAIKFRGDKPPVISITAVQVGEEWVIEVKDNGIGIDPQQYERIFLVFKKLHRRTQYPGTGIGLTICKKIVERHGGRIWVTSEPDKGSSFFFSLSARM